MNSLNQTLHDYSENAVFADAGESTSAVSIGNSQALKLLTCYLRKDVALRRQTRGLAFAHP